MKVAEFEDAVAITPTMAMFSATWCGPCKKIKPLFLQLEKEAPAVQFIYVDIDESDKLAEELGVRSVPDFRVYRNGVCIEKWTGASEDKLKKAVSILSKGTERA